MGRYIYSIVRCVPEPSTGEFVNIAAIAGDPEKGDWDVRQVENESHVRKLANTSTLAAVHGFLADIGAHIDKQFLLFEDGGEPLGAEWLRDLCNESRNVVQFSPPMPILAESSAEALDVVFQHMVIDPAFPPGQAGGD